MLLQNPWKVGWRIITDTPYYDLLDKANCADRCEAIIALCEPVDKLIADIQFLELECISTRYLLSQYMDKEESELLRMDIMSHLTGRYEGDPAYSPSKPSCTAVVTQWNSMIIMSRCRKPAKVIGLVGTDICNN